jgi:hypothetical protein
MIIDTVGFIIVTPLLLPQGGEIFIVFIVSKDSLPWGGLGWVLDLLFPKLRTKLVKKKEKEQFYR